MTDEPPADPDARPPREQPVVVEEDDDLLNDPSYNFDWRPPDPDDVPIEEPIEIDPETGLEVEHQPQPESKAESPPPTGAGGSSPGSGSILSLADDYLKSGNAPPDIRRGLPVLLRASAVKTANWYNRNYTVHWYGPGIPYRYLSHATLLGASGDGKGATVTAFFSIVGERPGEPAIWLCETFEGGSIQGLRGGRIREKGELVEVQGAIERLDRGFVHIPEFTQIAEMGKAGGGAIQTIIAWADTGDMAYETMGGGRGAYHSEATLIVGLQPALLEPVEAVVLGWNRRSTYYKIPVQTTDEVLAASAVTPTAGDAHQLNRLRNELRRMRDKWGPTRLILNEVNDWVDDQIAAQKATKVDRQILIGNAVGQAMITGADFVGDVRIRMTNDVEAVLEQTLRDRHLARIPAERRGARDAFEVVRDRHVLGAGQSLRARDLDRILATRLSVGEHQAREFAAVLVERGMIQTATQPPGPRGGRPATIVKLDPRLVGK